MLIQIMAASSITKAIAEYDMRMPLVLVLFAVASAVVAVSVGTFGLAEHVTNQRLSLLLKWSAIPMGLGLAVGAACVVPDMVKNPQLTNRTIETIVHDELTAQYRLEDVEIEEFRHGYNYGSIQWARTLTDDSLEPAKVIVRIEEGPTVPYEVRLENNTLQLYTWHGDTAVPDPQHIRR